MAAQAAARQGLPRAGGRPGQPEQAQSDPAEVLAAQKLERHPSSPRQAAFPAFPQSFEEMVRFTAPREWPPDGSHAAPECLAGGRGSPLPEVAAAFGPGGIPSRRREFELLRESASWPGFLPRGAEGARDKKLVSSPKKRQGPGHRRHGCSRSSSPRPSPRLPPVGTAPGPSAAAGAAATLASCGLPSYEALTLPRHIKHMSKLMQFDEPL
ncbi:unnamed protein product [Prorocentrum cordatum]|uniref:Uncharacterized protein n=1 Tax=Prorocentrum cordatum TaxID=2364126 RepID=A0ABN9V7B6_9DINO|nr:unnamed protein product [Polarella glacialis]